MRHGNYGFEAVTIMTWYLIFARTANVFHRQNTMSAVLHYASPKQVAEQPTIAEEASVVIKVGQS